jgi:hypothetical protein
MVRLKCVTDPEQSYVDGTVASAYKGSGGKIVVVLVNFSQEEQHCDLGSAHDLEVYTTSTTANLEKSVQKAPNIILPARAVVTCVCPQGL